MHTLSVPSNPPAEESVTLFHGEDFHIMLPSLDLEVTFRNRSAPRSGEVVLLQGGAVVNSRAHINRYQSHLVIDAVTEGDEGIYTIKNPDKPEDIRHKVLVVRGTERIHNSFSFQISIMHMLYIHILTKCPQKCLTNISV